MGDVIEWYRCKEQEQRERSMSRPKDSRRGGTLIHNSAAGAYVSDEVAAEQRRKLYLYAESKKNAAPKKRRDYPTPLGRTTDACQQWWLDEPFGASTALASPRRHGRQRRWRRPLGRRSARQRNGGLHGKALTPRVAAQVAVALG